MMKLTKKAQGLPLNTIIIAAIALIVLVVMVAIFSGRIAIFSEEVEETGTECTDYPGAQWKNSCGEGEKRIYVVTDADEHPGQVCCQPEETQPGQ